MIVLWTILHFLWTVYTEKCPFDLSFSILENSKFLNGNKNINRNGKFDRLAKEQFNYSRTLAYCLIIDRAVKINLFLNKFVKFVFFVWIFFRKSENRHIFCFVSLRIFLGIFTFEKIKKLNLSTKIENVWRFSDYLVQLILLNNRFTKDKVKKE